MKRKIRIAVLTLLGVAALPVARAAQETLVPLTGHVSNLVQTSTRVGRMASDEPISLELVVRIDQTLLDQTLSQIYGSRTGGSRHFLSAAQFSQLFGIDDKREQLKNFAQAHGLSVDLANDEPGSLAVKVSGPASVIENTFHVQLNQYRKSDGRLFHAIETEPLIPSELTPHLDVILGLSNGMNPAHPHIRYPTAKTNAVTANIARPASFTGGTGPNGYLSPADIKSIYGLSATSLDGTGQTLALFELDGFTPSDITHYETLFGLSSPPITFIGVDGQTNTIGAGAGEVTLDIELPIALAPGLSKILVYDGPNPGGIYDVYNKIATDNLAQIVSTSWGLDEGDAAATAHSEYTVFQRMAAQGQTIYAAAGDCGSYDEEDPHSGDCITTDGFHVDDPASQPYVTGVGGTSLSGSVSAPVETTWNEFGTRNIGGGGGVSSLWAISQSQASYQIGLVGAFSQTFRNVPDVSLNSDPDAAAYAYYFQGSAQGIGGTSCAAPLWAALTALVNQERMTAGEGPLGFANPTLYTLPESTVFNDVTTGNNGTSGHYNAGPGYDNATGFGSFKGSAILAAAISATPTVPPTNPDAPLSSPYGYPNPWDVRKDQGLPVTFKNIPTNGIIKIFTLSGFWIRTLNGNGLVPWDLKNDSGDNVASGLYLYLINGDGISNVRGKIAVIR